MQIGPYTIERELGRGGMGAVYLGRASPAAAPVAIKVVHSALSWDPDVEARFQAEGDALEALSHPNLVQLRGRGRGAGGHWIAMDYVEGRSLGAHLKTHGPWQSEAARDLMLGLCAGIAHAHYEGVLHRDLKPENVILRAPNLHPLIVDFGLARPLDISQHLTATGEILGSPGYLAPEQCGVGGAPTPATDVYGLGAVLYTVLTGEPPFRGASLLGTLDMVNNAAPRRPRELRQDIDPWLEAVCLRCLAKDPRDRFRDAAALADALEARSGPTPKRGPGRTLALASTLVLLGGGAWLGWRASPETPGPRSSVAPTASALSESPASSLWRGGPWGALHLELGERVDPEALAARQELISSEAEEIELREEAWVARRARAIRLARQGAGASAEAAAAWVRTVAIDDFYGLSLDPSEELVAARDRARGLVGNGDSTRDSGEAGLRLNEVLARLELKVWRGMSRSKRGAGGERVLSAWARLLREEDRWWRKAVRVEVLSDSRPEEALRVLQQLELAAGTPSTQAWVEYLRVRFLIAYGAKRSKYLSLLEAVGDWPEASPTLRAMARLRRGAQLDLGSDPRARAVLESVDLGALSPQERLGPRLRLARLSLRAGELAESEALLASLPSELAPEFRFHLSLLRAELRAREGKLEEADRALSAAGPPVDQLQEAGLLYLRAALGHAERAGLLAKKLCARGVGGAFEADGVLRRAASDPLWKEHAGWEIKTLAERVGLRLEGTEITAVLRERMLNQGSWRELIRLARVTLADKEPRRYASFVARALGAAEELDVPGTKIAAAAREAAKAIRGVSPRKAQARSLLGAIALRQNPPRKGSETQARQIAAYSRTLGRAQAEEPEWTGAPAELIRFYAWAGSAHPEFEGLGHPVARLWLAKNEESLAALRAVCRFERVPVRFAQLGERAKGDPLSSERAEAILAIRRWGRHVGAEVTPLYHFVHKTEIRPALRRELHLEEARRELGQPGKEAGEAALATLARLRRWCPPLTPSARLELLVARASLRAGHLEQAGESLARAREIEGLDKGELAELLMLDARRLQVLGAKLVEIKRQLLASVAAGGFTSASSLDYARLAVGMKGGAPKAALLYGQALGYERPVAEVKQILSEVQVAGADPEVALELGARGLALRVSALKALDLVVEGASELKDSDRLKELRAVTLVRLSRERLERGMTLPEKDASFMKGPWAVRARLLLEIHQVRAAARAPGGEGQLVRLLELEKTLALEAQRAPREIRTRWALLWELGQIAMDLARAPAVAERSTHAERAEALLADAEEQGNPELARSLNHATALGQLLGDPKRAAGALAEALARAKLEHQVRFAGVLARARAIYLFRLGRFEEALSELRFAIESGLEPALRGDAYLQQALCLQRLGREGVLASLRRARISTPGFLLGNALEIQALEVRWGGGSRQEARQKLGEVEGLLDRLKPGPREAVRGLIRVAEAELWRLDSKPERALQILVRAMEGEALPSGSVVERLACDEALGPKGRADLLKWGPGVLKNPNLFPYEAALVRAALDQAD